MSDKLDCRVFGKNKQPEGVAPAIYLVNTKYPHNVGSAVRAASCFGVRQVWFSGDRVQMVGSKGYRIPREERMRGYRDVQLRQHDHVFDEFDRDVTPVAIELREGSENLAAAVYLVLYDRMLKRWQAGLEELPTLAEPRGEVYDDEWKGLVQ